MRYAPSQRPPKTAVAVAQGTPSNTHRICGSPASVGSAKEKPAHGVTTGAPMLVRSWRSGHIDAFDADLAFTPAVMVDVRTPIMQSSGWNPSGRDENRALETVSSRRRSTQD
ncbi:hypothetical protein MRX96_010636 [Rhipicephalus microplus]